MLHKIGALKSFLISMNKKPDIQLYTIMENNGYNMDSVIRAYCEINADKDRELLTSDIKASKVHLWLNPKKP